MSERINYIYVIVGQRGSGKTYYTRNTLMMNHQFPKTLICDTLDHPAYRDIPELTVDKLNASIWKKGTYRIFRDEPEDILIVVGKRVFNCFCVFEDAQKYIPENMPRSVVKFIIDSKQQNNDLVFMFHSLDFIPPKLWKYLDYLVVFRTKDEEYKSRVPKFVIDAHQKVKASPDPYAKIELQIS